MRLLPTKWVRGLQERALLSCGGRRVARVFWACKCGCTHYAALLCLGPHLSWEEDTGQYVWVAKVGCLDDGGLRRTRGCYCKFARLRCQTARYVGEWVGVAGLIGLVCVVKGDGPAPTLELWEGPLWPVVCPLDPPVLVLFVFCAALMPACTLAPCCIPVSPPGTTTCSYGVRY